MDIIRCKTPPWQEIREVYFLSGYDVYEPNPDLSEVNDSQVIMAMDGQKPVGFAIWRINAGDDWAKVVGLAVAKSHQGTTLAWRLVKLMVQAAIEAGANRLAFMVHKNNTTFQRMVEAVGCSTYQQDAIYNFYYLPIKEKL